MGSKYDEIILDLLSKNIIKSTNEVRGELQERTRKSINWHALYRILTELVENGSVEKLRSKAGFFWRKK